MSLFRSKKDKNEIPQLKKEIERKDKRISQLEGLCYEKDAFFMELMSDGLRHGSPLAAKHMAERRKYKQGK